MCEIINKFKTNVTTMAQKDVLQEITSTTADAFCLAYTIAIL